MCCFRISCKIGKLHHPYKLHFAFFASDIDKYRLQIAKNFKAADFIYQTDSAIDTNAEDLAEKLRVISKSAPHAALECCGADIALVTGVHVS